MPDNLPEQQSPHPAWDGTRKVLANLCNAGNPYAQQLCRLLAAPGQSFLATLELVLRKPVNQDVVVALLHAVASYLEPVRFNAGKFEYIDDIRQTVDNYLAKNLATDSALGRVISEVPELENQLQAMLTLALLDEPVVNPIFSRTDAIGSLMRKKLKPVSDAIQQQIDILRN